MQPLPHAADQCLQTLKDMANGVLLLHENVVLRRRALMEPMCDHRKHVLATCLIHLRFLLGSCQ